MLSSEEKNKRKEVSAISTQNYFKLKWIALLTMLIDHIGVCSAEICNNTFPDYESYITYCLFRCIGRIAFPVFCFQLVESFYFTKDKKKHLLKILGLAVISEIPYNLLHGTVWNPEKQNVCFTLALGFACIWISHLITEKVNLVLSHGIHVNRIVKFLLQLLNVAVFAFLAFLLKTDYSFAGILMIALMNFSKKYDMNSLFLMSFVILFLLSGKTAVCCFLAFAVILHFRKQTDDTEKMSVLQKKPVRIISSLFYPLHLLLLYLCRIILF